MTKKIKTKISLLLGLLLIFSLITVGSSSQYFLTASRGNFNNIGGNALSCISNSFNSQATSKLSYDELKLYPGGMPFGIKFITEGVLIIGFADLKTDKGNENPAMSAGLRLHDTVVSINGKKVNDAKELCDIVESSGGKQLTVDYIRSGEKKSTSLTPIFSSSEGKYKSGIYVRDNGAGIGTVTFIVPETLAFAGLGHGICDSETGGLIPMQRGSVVDVTINGVKRGLVGSPGEIKGYFSSGKIGTLLTNTECGVYGVYATLPKNAKTEALSVGKSSELKEGDAFIYCTLSDNTIGKYSIKIENIRPGEIGNKCFNVKITDPALIDATGGIVQGMSGSPIIQNGKIVGAVTHVLINDPTMGYGIFIENMLKNMSL